MTAETTPLEFPRIGINTQDLLDEMERLLELAEQQKDEMGAVNWAGLRVADIEYRLSMLHPESGPFCIVIIREASPDSGLAQWLHRHIDNSRFPGTYVECEW